MNGKVRWRITKESFLYADGNQATNNIFIRGCNKTSKNWNKTEIAIKQKSIEEIEMQFEKKANNAIETKWILVCHL